MKKTLILLALSIITISCGKKQGNMVIKGQIKGLKKGALYLQKIEDKKLVSVDSLTLFGDEKFTLSDDVKSPVMYYLTYSGNKENKKIIFFGEQGEITINDNIEEFGWKPKISGSKNQKVYEDFKKINDKFNLKRLDFIAKDIEARAAKDDKKVKETEAAYLKMVKRKFLFTTNFAINHKDFEAAPYIALSELFDANINLLDTINKSLTKKIKNSDYGKSLDQFVKDVKENNKKKQ